MMSDESRASSHEAALYRAVLSATLDPLIVIDAHGFILAASDSVERVFGWEPSELIGQDVNVLMPEPYHSSHGGYLERYRQTGETFLVGQPREFKATRKDGSEFPCEVSASLVDAPNHPEPVFAGIIRDLTRQKREEEERRQLHAKVQQTQKLESLGVLAGGIAHDFNNMLVGILGNARILLEDVPGGSPVSEGIHLIETAALRAAELTEQMLAYSGRGNFALQRVDLSKLVEGVSELLKVSISKRVDIRHEFTSPLPVIVGDSSQIHQVIMNLITNASDAIGDASGVMRISTGVVDVDRQYLSDSLLGEDLPAGSYVYLEVSDTGCGMDEVTMRRLFDPFFTTKANGRGLGLAALLGIMRGHRGVIRIDSELGRGTTFRALFPAVEAPADRPNDVPPMPAKRSVDGTILVVDDDGAVLSLTQRMLERAGCQVLTADNGRAAIDTHREHADEIDAVLLDMTMPLMDGEDVFRELRRTRPMVSVVLSSGYSREDALERFAGEGLMGFVQKPYGPAELVTAIRRALPGALQSGAEPVPVPRAIPR